MLPLFPELWALSIAGELGGEDCFHVFLVCSEDDALAHEDGFGSPLLATSIARLCRVEDLPPELVVAVAQHVRDSTVDEAEIVRRPCPVAWGASTEASELELVVHGLDEEIQIPC